MTWILIKLGIRLVVFGIVFGLAAWRYEKIQVKPKWALPLVAVVFALLNTLVYWLLSALLSLAVPVLLFFVAPLAANAALLYATHRLVKYLKVEALSAAAWLVVWLTVAHGAMWLILDRML